MVEDVLVFIDEGFLSKLSKHFGNGKYIKINYIQFAKNLTKKQNLFLKHLFYYTAPPFQDTNPTKEQINMKQGYDKFVSKFKKNKEVTVREGRCQRLIDSNGKINYHQKGVDALMVADMVSVPMKYKNIKKIILITSDTDFCPIIGNIDELGIKVLLCTYYEKKRDSKFSMSHHLIDCCNNVYYLNKEDFNKSKLK